jgi:2-methylcitrate dehydratase PrpD
MTTQARRDVDAAVRLAALVAETATADIPAATIETARTDLLDTLGCAIAGENAMGVPEARMLALEWGGAPIASVWGTGRRTTPPDAAFANAVSGHALDYDDQHPGICHTGVSVIPAALAAAETAGVTDLRDVLAAIVLGTEVADRIAVAPVDGPGVTGWLFTPLCGYFGAAAAAARLAGLDPVRTGHALGFAYVQTSGNGQSTLDGALAKRMQPAFAARGGVFGAALAQRGLTAPINALEGKRGYFHVYHRDRYDPDRLHDGLGESWLIDSATYKPYPCCAWTHAGLECAIALRDRGIAAADIVSVEVGVNAQAYASAGSPLRRRYTPQTPVDAQFSIPYTFAAAFLTGGVGLADFSPDALARPDVLALAGRVQARIDPEIDAREGREVSPAAATATLGDGSTATVQVWSPRGRGERVMTRDDIVRKFHGCCAYADRSPEIANRLADVILTGGADAVEHLCELLRRPA